MMIASLHCSGDKMVAEASWVRRHSSFGDNERQDYFAVRVGSKGGEITLFLTPDQLDSLSAKLAQASLDRSVVLAEEAKAAAVLELAGEG